MTRARAGMAVAGLLAALGLGLLLAGREVVPSAATAEVAPAPSCSSCNARHAHLRALIMARKEKQE